MVRAVIGFFTMAIAALLGQGIWSDNWSMAGGLMFILALPAVLLALLPLPDFRWESVTAAAGGLALGLAAGIVGTFNTEDSGNDLLWWAALIYASFGFVAYGVIGAAMKGAYALLKQRRLT